MAIAVGHFWPSSNVTCGILLLFLIICLRGQSSRLPHPFLVVYSLAVQVFIFSIELLLLYLAQQLKMITRFEVAFSMEKW